MKISLRNILFMAMATMLLVFAAACGNDDEAKPETPATGGDTPATGGETADAPKEADRPSTVTIGTASQGGVYYIYGGALASLLDKEFGITSNVEVTGGPVHNMQLTQTKDIDIGMVTLGPGYEGITGTGEWTGGQKLEDVRVVFPMYTTPFHWWALKNSGVDSIHDMKGMRVGVGPAGGTSGTYLPLIHKSLGLDTSDVQAGASDMTSQQMDGQLDVIGFAAGIPIPAVSEVETQRDIVFFGIDGADRDKVIADYPYFFPFTIPADTYTTLNEDLETIAMFNFGIVSKDMNEDFVYELVKAYHENQDDLMITHKSAAEAVPEAILNNEVMPLHPGAIRYYEEIGIDLPSSVYPN